ncbi:Zn-dependent oligopeptidase [Aurantiacibacter sp. MUD11]|uniref:M3 family metallopeptidase n=1 Tax=Aurantiacibacter sp. MUD11 TaxID=3003265 RepID=UPI0022AA6EC5|nr:M3 family metallopeptidase [Aurantiacibacter sp. MUD11]WAT18353.1 Zn-dependent oligopeptidase [Aurantiacibacter sp. MUD11]
MKKFTLALVATTALSAPAQAADVSNLVGPFMHDPTVEEIAERCQYYVEQVDLRRDAMLGDTAEPTIDNTLERYDAIQSFLLTGSFEASLYQQVMGTAETRDAGGACSVRIAGLSSEISLSRPIYERLAALDVSEADETTQTYMESILDGFRRSGVALDEDGRARVQEINDRLAELSAEFSRNIAEDVRTIEVAPEELAGLPQDYIDAHPVGENGMITLTSATPDYAPVMTYAESDDLRRRYADVYGQRAWPQNDEVLREIFTLRQELAELVGFNNYAELQFADRMLDTTDKVEDLIQQTDEAARPVAEADYAQLFAMLQELRPGAEQIESYQLSWLTPKVQQANYDYDPQEARQYFQHDNVRDGIWALTERLFGVEVQPWDTPVWHEDVEPYQLVEDGEVIGYFYLDSHPRPGKYTHANVVPLYLGSPDGGVPVAALVQNMPDGLMEHGQVTTFLHEFGHILHFVFGSRNRYAGMGMINVEWDFIEAPSQILENWVYDYDTLATFAVNEAGETIPRDLVERMNRVRYFNQGTWEMRQLGLTATSYNFYTQPVPDDLGAATREWQQDYSLVPLNPNGQMQAAFGHLDGYGAAYYTYGWSRVIAADMFSRFKAEGMTNPETANAYRRLVLEPGGTRPAAELVREFVGREISFDAFREELERGLPED